MKVPTAEEIDSLSVGQLRLLIARAGLSATNCVEKSELRERAKEAASILLFEDGRA